MKKLFTVSIIGRPNVGKSSLFNWFVGRYEKALTYDRPGVTRDRNYNTSTIDSFDPHNPREIMLVDTGGFFPNGVEGPDTTDVFFNIMKDQAAVAVEESDLVLFVCDLREGLLHIDHDILHFLRESGKEYYLVLNKYDSHKQSGSELEFYGLGVPEDRILMTSTAHGIGVEQLKAKIHKRVLKEEQFDPEEENTKYVSKVAILGMPNVGKSTLLNRLLRQNRSLVSDIAGTTVDPVHCEMDIFFDEQYLTEEGENPKKKIQIVDTAGIRKQKKVKDTVELQSVYRSLRSIQEAEIVIYVTEMSQPFGKQDKRLIDIALEKGKSVILCVNKSDLFKDKLMDPRWKQEWLADLYAKIPWLEFCEIVPLSAKTGDSIKKLKRALAKTIFIRNRNISTAELNNLVTDMVEHRPLLIKGTKAAPFKVKYASMVRKSPPTVLLFANRSKNIPEHFKTYLRNGIRNHFNFENTPVHLIIRSNSDQEKRKS